MNLFIGIIFIAELIIAGTLINWILKIDKKAKDFTVQWIKTEKDSIKLIKEFKGILVSAQGIMDKTVDFVKNKKKQFRRKLINLVIIYTILIVFKMKFKRAAMLLQYFIIASDLWKSIPA